MRIIWCGWGKLDLPLLQMSLMQLNNQPQDPPRREPLHAALYPSPLSGSRQAGSGSTDSGVNVRGWVSWI